MDRDRTKLDVLDQRDHRRPAAALWVTLPGPRGADCRRDRQIAETADCPITLDHSPIGGSGLLSPKVKRICDPLRASSLFGFPLAFQVGGIGRPA
jgi:hypothetical protein